MTVQCLPGVAVADSKQCRCLEVGRTPHLSSSSCLVFFVRSPNKQLTCLVRLAHRLCTCLYCYRLLVLWLSVLFVCFIICWCLFVELMSRCLVVLKKILEQESKGWYIKYKDRLITELKGASFDCDVC